MATDWTTLTGAKSAAGSVKNLVGYEEIDSEGIIEEAEAYAYGAMRVREMLASGVLSLSLGASTLALPARFLDPIKVLWREGIRTRHRTASWLLAQQMAATASDGTLEVGPPTDYAIFDEQMNFSCGADQAYTGKILFYQRPAPLSASNTSNWLCTRYPNILRALCRRYGYAAQEDQGEEQKWAAAADALIARANTENDFFLRGIETEAWVA